MKFGSRPIDVKAPSVSDSSAVPNTGADPASGAGADGANGKADGPQLALVTTSVSVLNRNWPPRMTEPSSSLIGLSRPASVTLATVGTLMDGRLS